MFGVAMTDDEMAQQGEGGRRLTRESGLDMHEPTVAPSPLRTCFNQLASLGKLLTGNRDKFRPPRLQWIDGAERYLRLQYPHTSVKAALTGANGYESAALST